MRSDSGETKTRFKQVAEGIAAALLAALFLTFVLQIFARYVLADPFGWTLELCLTLWIWIVFWGNAFIVSHQQHVSFDLVYLASKPPTRRIFALTGAAAIAIAMAISLVPTLDYIDFMKIQKSAALRIPLRTIFSIYAVFIVAVGIAYAWRFVQLLRRDNEHGQGLS